MDCKPESSARTFFRITLIAVQGMLACIIDVASAIIFIPFAPIVLTIERWQFKKERDENLKQGSVWRQLGMLPLWVIQSFCIGCIIPFSVFRQSIRDIRSMMQVEWHNRWMAATPKTPEGHPISIEK